MSLTYRRHLESLRDKLTSRFALLRRLAGSGWGAGATTLQTATLALVHSTAEHCAPVWCHSANTHLIDPTINDALRIVTGCLRHTPADNLPILAGIQPAEFRRNGATLSLARRDMESGHLLHSALTRPSSANARRLKSRHPFVPAAQQLISSSDDNSIRAALWADYPPPRRYWKFSLLFAQMKHGRFCYLSVAHRPPPWVARPNCFA